MIIGAHNYDTHFGRLSTLQVGDDVVFTDLDGNVFIFEVSEREILRPDAFEDMESGDWDMTLFTCTVGGASRLAVRCRLTEIRDSANRLIRKNTKNRTPVLPYRRHRSLSISRTGMTFC